MSAAHSEYEDLVPSEWAYAFPWHRLLFRAVLNGSKTAAPLCVHGAIIEAAWVDRLDRLRSQLVERGLLPRSAMSIDRAAFVNDPFVAQAATGTNPGELEALRRSQPQPRRVGGPVDVLLEWTAAGIVGNFAYFLLARWVRQRGPSEAIGRRISNDEVVAFLELYLSERVHSPDELVLVLQQTERTGIRQQTSAGTEWCFALVGPTVEYRVALLQRDGEVLPSLVQFGRRASSQERYDKLITTGVCDPPPAWP